MNTIYSLGFPGSVHLAWSVDVVAKVTILLISVAMVNFLIRRRSAATRHWLWFMSLTSILIIPLLSMALPRWQVLPPTVAPHPAEQSIPTAAVSAVPDLAEPLIALKRPAAPAQTTQVSTTIPVRSSHVSQPQELARPSVAIAPHASRDWARVALIAWLIGCAVTLLPVLFGVLSLRRLIRRSTLLRSDAWNILMQKSADLLCMRRRVELLQSDCRSMPMTWGISRARVLVPAAAADWPEDRRRAVILHELAHVKRADCLTDLIARIACSILWFHPLAWFALLRMRDLRERACDDLVLAAGSNASDYAEHLLHVAAIEPAHRFTSCGIAMARRSNLKGRLEAILDDTNDRGPLERPRALILALAVLAMVTPLAMLRAATPPPAATQAATQPSREVSGSLLDMFGKPVADAEVVLFRVNLIRTSDSTDYTAITKVRGDANGTFHLPLPADLTGTVIRATAPGYACAMMGCNTTGGQVTFWDHERQQTVNRPSFVLPPEAVVNGIVTDEVGKPISGARVSTGNLEQPVNTGPDGHFRLGKFVPSVFGVFYSSGEIEVRHSDYVTNTLQRSDIREGDENYLQIQLKRGVLLHGNLTVAETGMPLKGMVRVEPQDIFQRLYAWCDENGYYELQVPSERIIVRPEAGDNDASNYYPVIDVRTLEPTADKTPIKADFQFHRGLSISGKVTLSDALDVSTLSINVKPAGENGTEQRSNWHYSKISADGVFRVAGLKPGRYDVLLMPPPNVLPPDKAMTRTVELQPEHNVTDVIIAPPAGAFANAGVDVRGIVRLPDGKPAINARIVLVNNSPPLFNDRRSYTDGDGAFIFKGKDPKNSWAIWAFDASGVMGAAQIVTGAEQLNKPIELTLKRGAEFSGTVIDSNGKGLSSYRVAICEMRDTPNRGTASIPRVFTNTDNQGRYALTGFVPPTGASGFILEAMQNGDVNMQGVSITADWHKDFEIRPGSLLDGFDFVVSRTASHIDIKPKRAPTTPIPGSENRGDNGPKFFK